MSAISISKTRRQKLSPRRVKQHAKKLCQFLFPRGYAAEFFLCGGAFKPLLEPTLRINDLDLWVRCRRDREQLVAALIDGGAELVQDFVPDCISLQKDGMAIEISFDEVGDRGLADIVGHFDLACSAVGVRYEAGRVRDAYISRRLLRSRKERVVLVEDGYLDQLREQRPPSLLRSIDRMRHFAADAGYQLDSEAAEALWEVFATDYDADEKQQSLDSYMETTVGHKSHCDAEVLRRASELALQA